MILTFKEQFVPKIIAGTKKTTFRTDKTRRWKKGMKIHFWKDNPRNVQNNPYQFATGIADSVVNAVINPIKNYIIIHYQNGGIYKYTGKNLDSIAQMDGFDNWEEMKAFFPEPRQGVVIEWRTEDLKQPKLF